MPSLLMCEMMLIPCVCVQKRVEALGVILQASDTSFDMWSPMGLELSWLFKEFKGSHIPTALAQGLHHTTPQHFGRRG